MPPRNSIGFVHPSVYPLVLQINRKRPFEPGKLSLSYIDPFWTHRIVRVDLWIVQNAYDDSFGWNAMVIAYLFNQCFRLIQCFMSCLIFRFMEWRVEADRARRRGATKPFRRRRLNQRDEDAESSRPLRSSRPSGVAAKEMVPYLFSHYRGSG